MELSEYHKYIIERLKQRCPYYTNVMLSSEAKFIIKNSKPTYQIGEALLEELIKIGLIQKVNRKKIKIL